ncbi:unnamed protein product [Larinioides sclopetarius]|uniref:BED-type domain-containing protein n=3 Tax=Larinioides sclopetarius TaxID=280406 RepID=A0AAV2BTE9_9ARAC
MPGSCVFNALWLTRQEYSTVSDSRTKARCRLCLKDFDIGKMGESALKSHMAGKKHSEIMKAQVNPKITDLLSTSSSRQGPGRIAPTSKEILTDQAENNTIAPFIASSQCLDAELKWSLKCVESHYSYNSCKDISNLFQDMFPDSKIAEKFSCGPTKCSYLISFGIVPYIKNVLFKCLGDVDVYSLMFDEALNKSLQTKQMDLHIRFWNEKNQEVETRYVTSSFMAIPQLKISLENFVFLPKNWT